MKLTYSQSVTQATDISIDADHEIKLDDIGSVSNRKTDKKRDLEVLDVFIDPLKSPLNLTLDFLIV